MFSAKVKFDAPDWDRQEKKIIEYPADTFSQAIQLADYIIAFNTPKPLSIEILENDRVIASLRTIR